MVSKAANAGYPMMTLMPFGICAVATGKHSTQVIGAPHLRQTGTVTVCRNCSVLPATPFTVMGDTGDRCHSGLVRDSSIRETSLRVSAAVTNDTASSVNVMKAGSSVFMLMADGLEASCTTFTFSCGASECCTMGECV